MLHFNTHRDFKSLVDDITDANDMAQRLGIFDPENLTTIDTLTMWWEGIDKESITEVDLSAIDRLYYLKQWNYDDFIKSRLLFRMDLKRRGREGGRQKQQQQQQQQRYMYIILITFSRSSGCRRFFGRKLISHDAYSLVRLIPWLESDYPKRRRIYELLAKDGIWDDERPEFSFSLSSDLRRITTPATLTHLCHEAVCRNRKEIPRHYYVSLLPLIIIDSLDTFNERIKFFDKINWNVIDFLGYEWDEWKMVRQQKEQFLTDNYE